MIKKLHRQLTLLFTVTTGLILTAVVVGFLYSGSWKPLTQRGVLVDRAKKAAMKEHIDPSRRPVSSSLLRSSVFTVEGDANDAYFGCVLVLPGKTGFRSLTLLAYKDPSSSILCKQGLLFLLLNTAGIGALMLVCWILVGKCLRPIEESRKKQNEFIAAASHELRAPLAVIRSSVCAMASVPWRREQFVNNIDKECSRMASLVNDMLLLASADTGRWTLRPERLDMDTLLISIYERFQPLYRDKGVELILELPEDPLPELSGDEKRLEQALSILLDNALRYTPNGLQVRLTAAVTRDKRRFSGGKRCLCLSVADQGCGMDDYVKRHVFDRFYRADSARSDKLHYGLGLSIAKELVQLHGGSVSVADAPLGGAVFTVKLPAEGVTE